MDNYTLILDFIDYKLHLYSFCPCTADMAFKRSAVRSRLSPPKSRENPTKSSFWKQNELFYYHLFAGAGQHIKAIPAYPPNKIVTEKRPNLGRISYFLRYLFQRCRFFMNLFILLIVQLGFLCGKDQNRGQQRCTSD